MASAVVVLKHETSTLRQSNNFISIDLKIGVGDNVREVTSPAKFGSDPISGQDTSTYTGTVICLFFYIFFSRATAHTREPILTKNCSKDTVWCEEDFFGDEKCVILKFGLFYHKNTPKIGLNGQLPAGYDVIVGRSGDFS